MGWVYQATVVWSVHVHTACFRKGVELSEVLSFVPPESAVRLVDLIYGGVRELRAVCGHWLVGSPRIEVIILAIEAVISV
jgi:hypothetical protein